MACSNAMQQLGGAIGIAMLGTVFVSIPDLVDAFQTTLWIQVGVLLVAGALVCLLPKRARENAHA